MPSHRHFIRASLRGTERGLGLGRWSRRLGIQNLRLLAMLCWKFSVWPWTNPVASLSFWVSLILCGCFVCERCLREGTHMFGKWWKVLDASQGHRYYIRAKWHLGTEICSWRNALEWPLQRQISWQASQTRVGMISENNSIFPQFKTQQWWQKLFFFFK